MLRPSHSDIHSASRRWQLFAIALMTLLMSLITSASVLAQTTLFSQNAGSIQNAGFWNSSTTNFRQGYTLLDDFVIAQPAKITQLKWRGLFYNYAQPSSNPALPNATLWQLQFTSNYTGTNGTHYPHQIVYNAFLPNALVNATFVGTREVQGNTLYVYDFSTTLLTPFYTVGGEKYWFSTTAIIPNYNQVLWAWLTNSTNSGVSHQFSLPAPGVFAYEGQRTNLTFSVLGSPTQTAPALFGKWYRRNTFPLLSEGNTNYLMTLDFGNNGSLRLDADGNVRYPRNTGTWDTESGQVTVRLTSPQRSTRTYRYELRNSGEQLVLVDALTPSLGEIVFHRGATAIRVDARNGFGLLTGKIEDITQQPLQATLSPKFEIYDPLSSSGYRPLRVWMGVDSFQTTNGAELLPFTNDVAGLLARLRLIAPDVPPAYKVAMPFKGSSANLRVKFTLNAAVLTTADLLLNFVAAKHGRDVVTPSDIISAYDNIQSLSALLKAAEELRKGMTNKARLLIAIPKAMLELSKMSNFEKRILGQIIETHTGIPMDLASVTRLVNPLDFELVAFVRYFIEMFNDLIVYNVIIIRERTDALELRFIAD